MNIKENNKDVNYLNRRVITRYKFIIVVIENKLDKVKNILIIRVTVQDLTCLFDLI